MFNIQFSAKKLLAAQDADDETKKRFHDIEDRGMCIEDKFCKK